MPEPATLTGLFGLILTNISAIIIIMLRDRRRNRKEDGKNDQIGTVQKTIEKVDEKINGVNNKVVKIVTEVKSIHEKCGVFEREIKNNREKIFDLVKK